MDATDRRIVEATQAGLPLVPRPYHAVAEAIGIAPADLARVPTPFAQLEGHDHTSRARALKRDVEQSMSGLGLPLAVLAWGEEALPAAVILFMVENTLHFSFGARLLDPHARLLTLWRVPVVAAAISRTLARTASTSTPRLL